MNKLLYNQSIIAVNRKTQNTYMIIIQYDTDYYILNHSHGDEKNSHHYEKVSHRIEKKFSLQ